MSKSQMSIYIDDKLKKDLARAAKFDDRSVSSFCVAAIREAVQNKLKK